MMLVALIATKADVSFAVYRPLTEQKLKQSNGSMIAKKMHPLESVTSMKVLIRAIPSVEPFWKHTVLLCHFWVSFHDTLEYVVPFTASLANLLTMTGLYPISLKTVNSSLVRLVVSALPNPFVSTDKDLAIDFKKCGEFGSGGILFGSGNDCNVEKFSKN